VTTSGTPTENLEIRAKVYGILALAFYPPKPESGKLIEAIHQAQQLLHPNDDPILQEHNPQDLAAAQLSKEHLRLFVGPGRVPCPPYESVYRQDRPTLEKGLVMGPSTADVRNSYAEANLTLPKSFTDLPDHIAVEMEFMHFLCTEEARLTEQGNSQELAKIRKMQTEFLNEHLKPWVNDFAGCVTRSSNSYFYKAAASLLKTFIENESETLLGIDTL
jgi:TorA maturation chaperone TorD